MIKQVAFAPRGELAIAPQAFGMMVVMDSPLRAVRNFGSVAVVDVVGPLMHHEDPCFDSYDSLKSRIGEALADPTAKCVLMSLDSPGGLVPGLFDTVTEIEALCQAAEKPLYCYVDSEANSAAYAIATAADKIFIPVGGVVGSIGVIATIVDQSVADASMGLGFTLLTSGTRKADGNPHLPPTEQSLASQQARVDELASIFHQMVAERRGISVEEVAALEAATFVGQRAVALKLADEIMSFDQVIAHLQSDTGPGGTVSLGANEAAEAKGNDMTYKEALAALKATAEDKDAPEKERMGAKKALAALEPDGDEKAEGEGEPDGDEKAEHSEPDGDEVPAKKDEEKAKASASHGATLALAAQVQQLTQRLNSKEQAEKRAALMASRPDLDQKVVAWLNTLPVSAIEGAIAAIPRSAGHIEGAKNAASASPIVGEAQAVGSGNQPDGRTNISGHGAYLDKLLGLAGTDSPIQNIGNVQRLGVMTPKQAREYLAAQSAKGTK